MEKISSFTRLLFSVMIGLLLLLGAWDDASFILALVVGGLIIAYINGYELPHSVWES
ncbi:hypothetical protein HY572_07010 [Candidatus Micrarchaeota archaeon]|nr:hypothetical protein [Candidatus Micrarchaeota archaeon]